MGIKNPEHLGKIKTPEMDKYNKAEKESHVDGKEIAPAAETRTEEDQKEFNLRLADLKMAVAEMEKHNKDSVGGPKEEITEEIFENIMNMPVSEFMEYANGGKNINKPDLRSVHNQVSGVINGEFNEEYKGGSFRQVMNKPMTKVFFAAFCLFLKFGVHAQAHEATVKENPDSGHKIGTNFDGGGKTPQLDRENAKDTYKLDAHNTALESLKEVSTMDIDQSFKVDDASISDADAKQIESAATSFLDKINDHTFKDFKETIKQIKVSSDERATKFGAEDKKAAPTLENNKNLSEARGEAAVKVLTAAIEKHDFSKSDLSADQIKEIKNTKFEVVTPEKGYTKITELNKINPETGKTYTDKDVEDMKVNNKALYDQLTKECRYAKVDLMVESEALQKIVEADRAFVFIDKSPSSEHLKGAVAKTFIDLGLKQNKSGNVAKVDLVFYSNGVDKAIETKNVIEAAEKLKIEKDDGAGYQENPFASSIKYLEKVVKSDAETVKKGGEVEKNRVVYIAANEGLQDAKNLFKAIDLMEKANVDVKAGKATLLMYQHDETKKPLEIKLTDLKDKIEKAIKLKIAAETPNYAEKVEQSQKDLNTAVSNVIEKVSPKLLQKIFQDNKTDLSENDIKEKLIKGDYKYDEIKWAKLHNTEHNLIKKVAYASRDLEAANKNLEFTKGKSSESVEHYMSTHNVQIKTFTDDKGKKATFDIFDGADKFSGPGYIAPRSESLNL